MYLQLYHALPCSCYSNRVGGNSVDEFADYFNCKPRAQGHKIWSPYRDMVFEEKYINK